MLVSVTGGCGFIGSQLVPRLLADGCSVVVLDDFSSGHPDRLPAHPHLKIIRGCVTDAQSMQRALEGADRIFHLASLVGQVNVSRLPDWTVRVSTESVRHINRLAPEALLVLASSSAVYGMGGDMPCREDEDVTEQMADAYDGGVRSYAFGKWQSERIAEERAPGTWLIVRPFNVIGPGQLGAYGMVVPRFVRGALLGEALTIYGTGAQTRSFSDVHAFVDHLLGLVDAWSNGARAETVFNIGSRAETSIRDLAETIDRVLGTATSRRYVPYHEVYPGKQDVQRRRPSLERTEALLGPLACPALESTIEKVAADLSATLQSSA